MNAIISSSYVLPTLQLPLGLPLKHLGQWDRDFTVNFNVTLSNSDNWHPGKNDGKHGTEGPKIRMSYQKWDRWQLQLLPCQCKYISILHIRLTYTAQ